MKINGTIVNYFIHCKRQCYLHAYRINLEDNSENVKIGKVLHKEKAMSHGDFELAIDNVKIDRITKEYIIETKKSDADIEAAKWQLVYYLYILKKKNIRRKGKLEFIEKNRVKSSLIIELDEKLEDALVVLLNQISEFLNQDQVPEAILTPKCKKCAYYYYCLI